MKYVFSTLGCPDWNFKEILSAASDLGYDGVEIRGIENEVFSPFAKPFLGAFIDKSIDMLKAAKISIEMLATGVVLSGDRKTAITEATAYVDLAVKLGVPYIRVMITNKPYPEPCDVDLAKSTYCEICRYAKGKNVIPLVETNGILADSAKMKNFIEDVIANGCDNCGVLWDVHHPYRFNNESVDTTCANIGKYVKYVHVKDSVMADGKVVYKLMGQGDVPVVDAVKALKNIGYDSCVCLEWVKRWCPDLEEPGIVFSHFSKFCGTKLKKL